MKYNKLTVLEEVSHKQRRMFKTLCDCGRVDLKRKDWVISGRTKSCKSCASRETVKNFPPPIRFLGIGGLSKTHFSSIRLCALRRNIPFDVSIEFLWKLYEDQLGLCALSGVPIVLKPLIKNSNVDWSIITASIDRIDSTLGYTEDNVWWVHKDINRLKNNYSMNTLLTYCQLILNKHGNPDPSIANEIIVAMKEQRLGGDDSTNNPPTSARHPAMDDDIV